MPTSDYGSWYERWGTILVWAFAIVLVIAFAFAWDELPNRPAGYYFSAAAVLGLIVVAAAVELLKYFLNCGRREILQKIKILDERFVEMENRMAARNCSSGAAGEEARRRALHNH